VSRNAALGSRVTWPDSAENSASGIDFSEADESECRRATHILTLGPAAILRETRRYGIHFARFLILKEKGRSRKRLLFLTNYDGSWPGNDTVWRMCLDLQRALHYARPDGGFADTVQRKVLSVTDGIVSGEGEGPLSPSPVAFGLMTLGLSTPAVDWVHALLIGLAPELLPLTREAFMQHRYPLAAFDPEEIAISMNGHPVEARNLFKDHGRSFEAPRSWGAELERHQSLRVKSGRRSAS